MFKRELYQFKFVYFSKSGWSREWSETVTFVASLDMYQAKEVFFERIANLKKTRNIFVNYEFGVSCSCPASGNLVSKFPFKSW